MLVEWFLALPLACGLAVGGLSILDAGWKRFQCARLAFEQAHATLLGEPPTPLKPYTVRLRSDSLTVVAEASCGRIREKVGLTRLESRP